MESSKKLMYDEKMIEISRFLYLVDSLATISIFLLSFWLRNYFITDGDADFFSHLFLIPLLLFFIIGFLSYFGAYEGFRTKTSLAFSWSVFRGLVIAIGSILALIFFLKIQYISRTAIIIFAFLELITLIGIRLATKAYIVRAIKSGKKALRVLILGTGERAQELSMNLRKQAELGIKIVGHLDPDPERVGQKVLDAPVIGTVDDIHDILKENIVDEVIIAIPRSLLQDAESIAYACEEEGIRLQFMADIFNLEVARVRLMQAGKVPLLTMDTVAQDEMKLLFKRCFDIILTVISIPVVGPLIGILAVIIKWDSPGPAFFVQERVGLKKRLFPMIKFRSMYIDAEEKLKEIEHLNEAEGPIFKIKDDPRVTRVGKFIRKTSLDELPQLINVFMGHMSLVGPRPMSIRDVDLFDKGIQRKRFSVKPGLTCIWQISGRSNLPFEKWLELDLQYIENWTLWLDIKILFKTIPAVLMSKGAV